MTKRKDWSGKKLGMLTIIKKANKSNYDGSILWEANCDCGNICFVVPHIVLSWKSQDCGCQPVVRSDGYNYTGLKYNKLTLTKRIGPINGKLKWEAICDCGNIVIKSPHDIKSGRIRSCGCANISRGGARQFEPIISTARHIFSEYKRYDPKMTLNFDEFYTIIQQNCSYCGREPSNERNYKNGKFTYNGVDRVDSNKPHTLDNVVPCCKFCNISKNNLTLEEFVALVKKQYEHLFTNQGLLPLLNGSVVGTTQAANSGVAQGF